MYSRPGAGRAGGQGVYNTAALGRNSGGGGRGGLRRNPPCRAKTLFAGREQRHLPPARQDFSNRLRRVGQPDADRVVDFFNSLMATMKEERLKTKQRHKLLTLSLIERSPMGVAMCDFDGNIESTNDAFDRFATPALEAGPRRTRRRRRRAPYASAPKAYTAYRACGLWTRIPPPLLPGGAARRRNHRGREKHLQPHSAHPGPRNPTIPSAASYR